MSLSAPLRRSLPLLRSPYTRSAALTHLKPVISSIRSSRTISTASSRLQSNMSFSNADTGSKTADPYVAKNLEHAELKDKVEDLIAFIDKQKFCMMTTRIADKGLLVSRCMASAGKEGNGVDLIFHANSESGKTDDLDSDPKINLGFLAPTGEWASISGTASIETDREKVRKYYSPALKAWVGDLGDGKHDGGPEDPRIVVIKVKAETVQYAVSRKTAVGAAVEFAKGVLTGEAPQINKLRHLDESELQQWRSSNSA